MEIRFFYPASYYPHKNHYQLIKAAKIIFKNNPEIKFTLTIEKDIFKNLSPNIDCIGNISRDKVIKQMKKSDALIFLSSFESLGIPLIEASNLGLPIVVPKLPYAVEILGSNAYYFDPKKNFSESLVNILIKFKEDILLNKVKCSSIRPKIITTDSLIQIFVKKLKK